MGPLSVPNKPFLLRIGLDFFVAGLLLVALAYYWLDNPVHELVGVGIFLLLIVHNIFNRRWYGGVRQARREPRRLLDTVLVLGLLVSMLVLVVTSLLISQTVFGFLSAGDGPIARRIHALAAYWVLVLVAIHLGIRWRAVLTALRNASGIVTRITSRVPVLRVAAMTLAAAGLYSSFEMDVCARLLARMRLDGWDFEAAAAGFFLHHVAIVGLYACLAHYGFQWLQRSRR